MKNKSVKALIELFTAKIWIDNSRKSFYPPKRKNQFYLQTWHAGFGLKRIENNAAEKLKPRYVKLAKKILKCVIYWYLKVLVYLKILERCSGMMEKYSEREFLEMTLS